MDLFEYSKTGSGPPVLLLHGFCENRNIWNEVAGILSEDFTIYMPDTPGHGLSPLSENLESLEDVGASLLRWMDTQGLNKCAVIGHSMGGYILLAAAALAPERFTKLGLFHSTCFADNDEKKTNRTKAADFVRKNGKKHFFDIFIPSLYHQQGSFIDELDELVRNTDERTIITYTEWMRDRPDRSEVLASFPGNVLVIAGDRDPFIDPASAAEIASLSDLVSLKLLEQTGHLGMMERPHASAEILRNFLLA